MRVSSVVYPLSIKSVVHPIEGIQGLIVVITFEKVSITNNSQVELLRLE